MVLAEGWFPAMPIEWEFHQPPNDKGKTMEKLRATARANELLKVIVASQPQLVSKTVPTAECGADVGAFITALRASLIEMFEADEEG